MESVLMPNEIEIFVESMTPQNMKNIGSTQWLEWHQRLQKLNQEALVEASALKEEHVKEALVCFGKVGVLIHEAILINIWKHKILPHLFKIEPNPESTFIAYSVLYHEALAVALLELVMYHADCCEALEDASVDLLDYVCGTVSQLLSIKYSESSLKQESPEDELTRQRNNLAFDIGIRSLSILRYLAENFERLITSVCSRIYAHHDVPVLLTEIILTRPWIDGDKLYSAGKWKTWDGEQLGQAEAQVWLTIRHLLLDTECARYYPLTQNRRTQLGKLLGQLRPTLIDQLSPLLELKHWLCKQSCSDQPAAPPRPLLLETVLEIKEKIIGQNSGRWKKIAEKQVGVIFTRNKETLQDVAKILSDAYNTDLIEQLDVKEEQTCTQCGKGAIQRCSRCKKTWYCSRGCQVLHWPQHKEECSSK